MWLFVLTVLSNICFGFFLDVSSGNAELMDEDLVKRIDAQVKVLTSNFHDLLIKVQNDRSEIGKQNKGLNQRLNTTVDNIKKLIINEEYLNQNIQALQTLTSEQQRELKKEKSISKKLTSNYNDLLFRVNREIDFLKNQNHYLEQKLNSTVEEMEKLMSEEETSSQNIVALQNITSQQQRDLDKEKSKSKKSRISVGSSWILLNNSLQELTNSTNIGFTNLNGNVLTENKLLREEMRKFEKRIKRRINKKLDNTVDGQWSSWIDTPSSVTCGVGCRLRYRECSNPYPQQGGKKCTGRRNKHVKCLQYDPCPVHGAWSVWSDNTCSVTCGVGTRSRSRSCSNPHPQYGGNNCTGNKINHVKCTHPNKCSGCQPDEWQCLSRRQCIPKEARCNDNFDCDDLSDELNCILPVQTCSYGLFRCGDGQCISPSYKCNKNKDCRDGSDESVALCAVSVEVDLLAAIGLPDPSKGVTNVVGLEGFPAFKLDKSSYIRKEAETYFTDRIKINDFAIVITVKVFSENGILFAVKGIYETVIAFGVRITAICNGKHNVVLYYNEEHTYGQISATIGNFTVDNIDKDSFTKLAIKVQGDIVTLFDNCEEVGRQQVLNRQPLQFRTGSPLYIGQGGPNVEDTSFEGVIQELKYYTNPAKAEELDCSSLDSGSGLGEVDLLAAIELPLRSKCVTNDVGLEGLPDLKLDKSSYIRKAAETYFSDKINDFAIVITVKVFSKDGILFAVKNIYESIMAFGVRITAIGNGEHNVVLYYKEDYEYGQISETIGNFTVDNLDKYSFTKLAIKVQGDTITLFDNCEEVGRQQVLNRQPLQFRGGSHLYIGQGGPNFEDTSFEGVIRELKYYTNPAKAEELDCSGYRGLRGRKGDRGRPGFNGLRGYKGDSGSVGPAGPPGLGFGGSGEILKGAKGALGETGLPGIPGTPGIGAQGQRGEQGEPGRNGLPGFQGPPGPAGKAGTVEVIRGPPGPPGPPGPSGVCTNDGGGEGGL